MGKLHTRPAVSLLALHPALRRGGIARWAAFLFICSNQEERGRAGRSSASAAPAKTRVDGAGRQNRPCGSHSTELALISVAIALANSPDPDHHHHHHHRHLHASFLRRWALRATGLTGFTGCVWVHC